MKREFYRTVIEVVVLSETPYNLGDLGNVYYDITDGDCSGAWRITEAELLTPKQMAKALLEQGSDPEFFMLDREGYDNDPDGMLDDFGKVFDHKEADNG